MTAAHAGTGWAVCVPTGYRVGDWEVTEPIATGNFGSVYAARHLRPGEHAPDVALKFMAAGPMVPRHFREILELARREVDFGRDTVHERLIRVSSTLVVQDASAAFDGAIVLVMERAEKSLQDLLDEATGDKPVPQARRLIIQICEGLEYLHASGWVHGDLKPSNILLMPDGSVRLADFGLATRLDGTHGYGPPFGSMDYLPPERHQDQLGVQGFRVRYSTDVWALGVTAHQILTGGAFPVPGSTAGARAAAALEFAAGHTPLRLHGEMDESWRVFVEKCLARDHSARPPAGTLLAQAKQLGDPQRAVCRRAQVGPVRQNLRPRWVRTLGLGFGLSVVALTASGGIWWPSAKPRTVEPHRTVELRVYNVEMPCRENQERLRSCSLGLAIDPYKAYDAANVSRQRMWHGDTLIAHCVQHDATYVADENGVSSRSWYKVAIEIEPSGFAWLPAVRTRDDASALVSCDPPAAGTTSPPAGTTVAGTLAAKGAAHPGRSRLYRTHAEDAKGRLAAIGAG
jgi:eukaryotic-like serine/threonine-protein kinase